MSNQFFQELQNLVPHAKIQSLISPTIPEVTDTEPKYDPVTSLPLPAIPPETVESLTTAIRKVYHHVLDGSFENFDNELLSMSTAALFSHLRLKRRSCTSASQFEVGGADPRSVVKAF